MGWWTDGEGARGYFSDDQCVPQGWAPVPAPDELPSEPVEEKPRKPAGKPAKKPAKKKK
jgi:hypothetical protein